MQVVRRLRYVLEALDWNNLNVMPKRAVERAGWTARQCRCTKWFTLDLAIPTDVGAVPAAVGPVAD